MVFYCELCQSSFPQNYLTHTRSHHPPSVQVKSPSGQLLTVVKQPATDGVEGFRCPLCTQDMWFNNVKTLDYHMKTFHATSQKLKELEKEKEKSLEKEKGGKVDAQVAPIGLVEVPLEEASDEEEDKLSMLEDEARSGELNFF